MERDEVFGRLLSIMNVLGKRVAKKNEPTIEALYMKDYARKPKKFFGLIHGRLMERSNSFWEKEKHLINIMGIIIDEINEDDFSNEPLTKNYLTHYYNQNMLLRKMGF